MGSPCNEFGLGLTEQVDTACWFHSSRDESYHVNTVLFLLRLCHLWKKCVNVPKYTSAGKSACVLAIQVWTLRNWIYGWILTQHYILNTTNFFSRIWHHISDNNREPRSLRSRDNVPLWFSVRAGSLRAGTSFILVHDRCVKGTANWVPPKRI